MKALWQQIPSVEITRIYCNTNFDAVVLDLEHGVFNNETLFSLIQLINASNKLSFVRVTEPIKSQIRLLLDSNVSGIIFSTLEIEQTSKIKEWCLYPPFGKRGQGLVSENNWGALIVIQRETGLRSYKEAGIQLKAEVCTPLLLSISFGSTHSPFLFL